MLEDESLSSINPEETWMETIEANNADLTLDITYYIKGSDKEPFFKLNIQLSIAMLIVLIPVCILILIQ